MSPANGNKVDEVINIANSKSVVELTTGNGQTTKIPLMTNGDEEIMSNVISEVSENGLAVSELKETKEVISFKVGKISFIILLILMIALGFSAGMFYEKFQDLKDDLVVQEQHKAELEVKDNEISRLNLEITELKDEIASLNFDVSSAQAVVKMRDITIINLTKVIEDRDNIISLFTQREELFNKYEHALYFGGKRTDITYDQLVFGINEMEERGMDPNLMIGLIKLETGFWEKMTSNLSSARGYGAFLGSSGKWVWEVLLENGEGTYNHDMALDGYVNLEMTAELLGWNMERYNGDVKKTLIAYNGNEIGERYYNIINAYIKEHAGYSIYDIQLAYQRGLIFGGNV